MIKKREAVFLAKQLEAMSLSVPEAVQQRAIAFLQLLKKWSRVYNLTAIDRVEDMITYHLLDSLSVVPFIRGRQVLDVGTGAGFPGVPLALYYPNKQFTLLDSNGKKTRFLVQAKADLSLENINIINSRSENYQTSRCFDVIIFRAVKSIPEIIVKTQHLCCKDGQFLAMKTSYPTDELQSLKASYTVRQLTVPGIDSVRHLIIIGSTAHE